MQLHEMSGWCWRGSGLPLMLSLILGVSSAHAEVTQVTSNGFDLVIEIKVPVSASVAYKQFLQVGEWWNSDHTWFGDSATLYIEPQAGGCFCEESGSASALHMIVSYVKPEIELRMIGGLGPLAGLGLDGVMAFRFIQEGPVTRIVHEYKVRGHLDEGFDNLSGIVNSVQTLQMTGLKEKLKDR